MSGCVGKAGDGRLEFAGRLHGAENPKAPPRREDSPPLLRAQTESGAYFQK
jgi:hypothetical protein